MNDQEKIRMDSSNIYREELFTDMRLGTIRRLVPVTPEGETDPKRNVRYSGQAQIMTPAGALPISFEIEAQTLAEAIDGFGEAAEAAIEKTVRELEELRQRTAGGIVMPGPEDISKISGSGSSSGGGLILP